MSLISVNDLTFAYEGGSELIFDHVSVQLDTGWKLGLTGRNGRGKTTFLRLLSGQEEHGGAISAPGVTCTYFPFAVPDGERFTLEVLEALCPTCPQWQLLRELNLLQVGEDALYRPFATLSNGEQTKALLAALFLQEGSYPLIDEPTNHLDAAGRETVACYLSRQRGFLLVSHDRWFLDKCIDHIMAINRTDIEVQRGNFSTWQHNRDLQDSHELAQRERLQRDMKRLKAAARQAADWSQRAEKEKKVGSSGKPKPPDRGYLGHKAAKMMKRARQIETRREEAAAEKAALLQNWETADTLKLHPLSYHARQLVEAKGLTVCYDGREICRDVSFTIERGERVALQGGNGSGKSSLLKLLLGEEIDHSGTLQVGSQVRISYVPQDARHLSGSLSAYAEERGIDESLFKAVLRKLGFARPQLEQDMASYSGGQKKKVLIAASLCQQAHLYVWDEPLNFMDVLSRIQLEQLLLEVQPTLLFVEHDQAFTEKIATKTVCL